LVKRSLNPENKATRVEQYARNIKKEVGIIAHACGVSEPRELRMHHARIVLENGRSIQMNKLYVEDTTVAAT
jgi:glutamate synthase domain-containing protein 2